MMADFLHFLLGLCAGALGAVLFYQIHLAAQRRQAGVEIETLRLTQQNLLAERARLEERVTGGSAELARLENDLALLRSAHLTLHREAAAEAEKGKYLEQRQAELKAEALGQEQRLKTEFENLANRILQENSAKFTQQNQTKLDELLKPFHERIGEFRRKVEEVHLSDVRERATLQSQIKSLAELNQQMSQEARNLTTALKGENKTVGSWGELILEKVLERSGLMKGVEYETQVSLLNEDGRRVQPDVIVNLPEAKHLVIDAKVSLTAYEAYCSAATPEEKARTLKLHLDSVRRHIRGLSEKKYQTLYQINAPDFVLLFVPVEPAFSLAIQSDPELFNEAFDRNIVLVTPSTLLVTLRTIAGLWKQEKQNRNALEIARRTGELLDKLADFCKDLEGIGTRLRQTQESYEAAWNKLKTGKGNLLKRAEGIQALGVRGTKALPPSEEE